MLVRAIVNVRVERGEIHEDHRALAALATRRFLLGSLRIGRSLHSLFLSRLLTRASLRRSRLCLRRLDRRGVHLDECALGHVRCLPVVLGV